MREEPFTGTSVLDELVFVGRSGPEPARPLVPVIADPEPEVEPTVGRRVARFLVLILMASAIVLAVGLAVGYAA